MSLEEYQAKRAFDSTPEPKGKRHQPVGKALRFVIQKHAASRLHYDFRLELDGVLKSWAVPKGPSLRPGDKRLAMMVEDHPYDYRQFEGIIPAGNYGAGTVMVWDEGVYMPLEGEDPQLLRDGLARGDLKFVLLGKKVKGAYALVKIKRPDQENAWLLIKKADEYATEADVSKQDKSVVSGRSMEEIASSNKVWDSTVEQPDLSQLPRSAMPRDIKPMLATAAEKAFDGDDWLFEVKWDGYRAVAEVDSKIKLYSRNQQSFNTQFAEVVEALSSLRVPAVLDGEVVAVDEQGRPHFEWLQNWRKAPQGQLLYCVFDLLWLDGHDLRAAPLWQRKEILRQILPESQVLRYSDHVRGQGVAFMAQAQTQQLEGIIAKHAESQYLPAKRSTRWQKIKTQLRQEAVIAGWTEPRGSRRHIGALVLGVYKGKELVYIGHSGGGPGATALEDIYRRLQPLERETSAFKQPPKTNSEVHWVQPKLLCEVSFTEWTKEGLMRQPILLGLRDDKPARQAVRERAAEQELVVNRHRLRFSNLDKVFWPDEGYTKGDVLDYYQAVSEYILPYLKDRPQSLLRQPNGIKGKSFFQKDVQDLPPDWVKTADIYSESNDKDIRYLICQDEATLLYMVQLGCIEINPWNSRLKKLENPDWVVMDLDPEAIGFEKVVQTAQTIKKLLDELKVPSFPKTSGKTGLHIYIPLGAKYSYEQGRQFAEIIARSVHAQLPKFTSVERNPAKRQGKVYIDYLQNRRGQTLAAPYSLRPAPGATVSAPLHWEELTAKSTPAAFNITNMPQRLEKVGDIWKPVLGKGINLATVLKQFK